MSLLSQRNFAGGVLAPALWSRVDTVKYQTGVKQARNFYIVRSGGLTNRAGTRFVGETKIRDANYPVRLIPFVFNADQTYMLEFGSTYMRVIKDGAYVLNTTTKNITAITQATQAVVTSTAHGYANGDEIYIQDITGMTELNGQNVIVSDQTTNTYKMKYLDGTYVNSTNFSAYVSDGYAQKIYEIATPYGLNELENIQYAQSGDVITIVDGINFPYDLKRTGHAAWTLTSKVLMPLAGIPQNVTFNVSAGTPQFSYRYIVTTIDADTYEESLAGESITTLGGAEPANSTPHLVDWDNVTNAAYYNVYVARSGHIGFIGSATTSSFRNNGITPDFTKTPPIYDKYFDYPYSESWIQPNCVNYAQQRLIFGNNNYYGAPTDQPEEIRTSRTGLYNNFTGSTPRQADDAIRFRMAGRQVNQIRHILDLNKLVIMTTGGEFTVEGGASGAITATDINIRQYSYHGSSKRPPIVIDANALFVQARGSIVRDFGFDYSVDGYKGNDLTVFSNHLFDGFEIVDWAYQKTPNSIVWAVRDDGTLLSLTYIREHQIWGWTTHDTDGFVERVQVIPEGIEDTVYIVVKREINGRTARYVERMATRFIGEGIDSEKDMIFMDSSLSYDGRNYDSSHTIEILNLGGDWTAFQNVMAEASVSMFTTAMIGQNLQIEDGNGNMVVLTIESIFDGQNAICRTDRTVPEDMRGVPLPLWTRAVKRIRGLRHLEGKQLSVFGDATVVGSPNNPANTVFTVTNGEVTLDKPYGVIHLGLPYIADVETLSIDNANGESLVDKKILINQVWLQVEKTRGLWSGTKAVASTAESAIDNLNEFKLREYENYDSPVALKTGIMDVVTESNFDDNGRVFLRQIDPLPATILSVHPAGLIPFT